MIKIWQIQLDLILQQLNMYWGLHSLSVSFGTTNKTNVNTFLWCCQQTAKSTGGHMNLAI